MPLKTCNPLMLSFKKSLIIIFLWQLKQFEKDIRRHVVNWAFLIREIGWERGGRVVGTETRLENSEWVGKPQAGRVFEFLSRAYGPDLCKPGRTRLPNVQQTLGLYKRSPRSCDSTIRTYRQRTIEREGEREVQVVQTQCNTKIDAVQRVLGI